MRWDKSKRQEILSILKVILTVILVLACPGLMLLTYLFMVMGGFWSVTIGLGVFIVPLLLPLLWLNNKKIYRIAYLSYLLCFVILVGVQLGIEAYERSITINVTPNINVDEYLPFDDDSKIVKLDSKLLNFDHVPKEQLPVIDGAAAAFPVYSAFVHAVYPEYTELYDGVFVYNNTVDGYDALARKETDIFVGAAPSESQKVYAEQQGTTFEYTQIGYEAFVFFVHKDNPVDSLTLDQVKGIYSGQITNWSQVGGKDEKIAAYQRNPGSGSQSMLVRVMEGTPIMSPEMKSTKGSMSAIVQEVADYKSNPSSIGFSFRFYVEGIIKHPQIKMIAIDGVAPTKENIRNGTYPIIAPVYAVTYAENTNENVQKLVDWMLSEEGQYIIEETGYVGMG